MIRPNKLKKRLKDGETLFGTWMVIPSPTLAEVFGSAGMDFIIIDQEHGPITFETAQNMVRAAEVSNMTPLLRVPSNDESTILRGLEIGSHGIVVPQMKTVVDVESVVKAVKYSPLGERGVSAFTRSSGFNAIGKKNRTQFANEQTLTVVIVESIEAINNIEKMVEIDEIDVVYIGTYDLSQSIGEVDNLNSTKMLKLIERTVEVIRGAGKSAGILAQNEHDVSTWKNIGVQFIPYQVDCGFIAENVQDIRNNLFSGGR
jgi:4-hydroxy-2-oxoheptanedioate aldolase